jgi:5-formyltetrahydrofolate cyclo-ligase
MLRHDTGKPSQEVSQPGRQKAEGRRLALACRDVLPTPVRAILSRGIGGRLLTLPEFERARGVLFYLAFRSEVETQPLIEAALALGKEVAVPVVRAEPRGLVPCRYSCPEDLARTSLGVLEPKPECACPVEPAAIDLIVVPGTAFDVHGARLGYGLGFYDRLLSEIPLALRVALAFECQLLPAVTVEPHDVPVDIILTEERVIRTFARRR